MMQNSVLSVCLIWVLSVIVSICIVLKLVFTFVKELADNGYCLSILSISNISNSISGSEKKLKYSFIFLFVPLINILFAFKFLLEFSKKRDHLIEGVNVLRFCKGNVRI